MRHLVLPIVSIFALGIALGALLMREPSKEYWEAIGPKWHCAFNPDYSEFCVEKTVGSDNI